MDILKKYYLHILVGVLTILTIGIYGVYCYDKFNSKEIDNSNIKTESIAMVDNEKEEKIQNNMHVEIKGQVVNPGVYSVTEENIINDVITMAGGLTEYAYTDNINLSKKVSDEMVIIVYSAYEYSNLNKPEVVYVEKPCTCPSVDITSCVEKGSSVIEDGIATSEGQNDNKVETNTNNETETKLININTATLTELESLNGIGEAKANAIIKYRTENGNFATIEDIINVSGISQNLFAKIKDYITV